MLSNIHPRLRLITEPDQCPPASNREERRHPARLNTLHGMAQYLGCHWRTISGWIDRGLITGYLSGKDVMVDLDEIERGFVEHPKQMRDPRRPRWSPAARIVTLPAGEPR